MEYFSQACPDILTFVPRFVLAIQFCARSEGSEEEDTYMYCLHSKSAHGNDQMQQPGHDLVNAANKPEKEAVTNSSQL